MKNPNTNQKGSIDTLYQRENSKSVRDEDFSAAKNSDEFRGEPGDQAFIVEWQMESNEIIDFNKKSGIRIETGFYLL
jgi:hypothetical protein